MHSSTSNSLARFGALAGLVGLFLLAGCGKVERKDQAAQDAAFAQLAQVPVAEQSSGADNSSSSSASTQSPAAQPATAQNLSVLIAQMIANGQIKVNGGRANASVNLDALVQIMSLITNGQANNVLTLVNAILQLPSLKGANIVSVIDSLITILNAALPVITPIAPQFVPVISALLTILPAVEAFLKIFVKPTPTPTAYYLAWPAFVARA